MKRRLRIRGVHCRERRKVNTGFRWVTLRDMTRSCVCHMNPHMMHCNSPYNTPREVSSNPRFALSIRAFRSIVLRDMTHSYVWHTNQEMTHSNLPYKTNTPRVLGHVIHQTRMYQEMAHCNLSYKTNTPRVLDHVHLETWLMSIPHIWIKHIDIKLACHTRLIPRPNVRVTYTTRSQKDETRNRHWNSKRNPAQTSGFSSNEHRSLFKGLIWKETCTLTIEDFDCHPDDYFQFYLSRLKQ